MIKEFVKKIAKVLLYRIPQRFYYYRGFGIYKSLDTLKSVIEKNNSEKIRNKELRSLSKALQLGENHKVYNELLKLYVPKFNNLFFESQKFIGVGAGKSSLNAYRKVKVNGEYYFEKVFFSSSQALKKILWFQEHAYKIVNKAEIKTDEIIKILKGGALTVVYTKFLNLKAIKEKKLEAELIELSKKLYRINWENIEIERDKLPNYITDYQDFYLYKRNIKGVRAKLEEINIDVNTFVKRLDKSKRVLTHGDIKKENVFRKSTVIDWDNFGFFPVGFDVAVLANKLIINKQLQMEEVSLWYEKNFNELIENCDESLKMKKNFYFLLLIFQQEENFSFFKNLKI